jgi:hypothetical protein
MFTCIILITFGNHNVNLSVFFLGYVNMFYLMAGRMNLLILRITLNNVASRNV